MIYVLSKNKRNKKKNHLKMTIFTAVKNHSILHRHVIVMLYFTTCHYGLCFSGLYVAVNTIHQGPVVQN